MCISKTISQTLTSLTGFIGLVWFIVDRLMWAIGKVGDIDTVIAHWPSGYGVLLEWAKALSPFLGLALVAIAILRIQQRSESIPEENTHSGNQPKAQDERISLSEFCQLPRQQGWDMAGKNNLDILDFLRGIRQAAIDGDVFLWGKSNRLEVPSLTIKQPLVRIPAEHFEAFEIMPDQVALKEANFDTQTYNFSDHHLASKKERYIDLHIENNSALAWFKKSAQDWRGITDNEKLQLKRRHA